jgi:cell wall-associated NlpC family hydrolase
MSIENAKKVVEWAGSQVGASYVWGGKGDMQFDPVHGLVPNVYPGTFDCSGLVTSAFNALSGIDHRGDWNSQIMLNTLEAVASESATPAGIAALFQDPHVMLWDRPELIGALVIYRAHVAILTGRVFRSGLYEVIEAAGGDETTLAPKPGGVVRLGAESHSPLARLGLRYLPGCAP